MKSPPATNFPHACPNALRLETIWHVLGAQFFRTIALEVFVLKTRANSSAVLASLPANEAMHVP